MTTGFTLTSGILAVLCFLGIYVIVKPLEENNNIKPNLTFCINLAAVYQAANSLALC